MATRSRKAVITVPAYFNDAQRQATIEAAQVAGFETEWEIEDPSTGKKTRQRMRIINEPTAASLAYGLDKKKSEKVAVFDLGGGTFDISILEIDDGVYQVLSTNGDTHLGGDDFDQVLIDYIAEEFKKENHVDLRKEPMALQRLKEAAERAKKDLSQLATTDIHLPFITAIDGVAKHLQLSLTRSKFEQLVDHLIEKCRGPVMQALKDAKIKKPSEIDEIVLVGGMTRVPKIQWLVKEVFGKEGHKGVNPDEVVAIGAAIQGAQLLLASQSKILLLDVHAVDTRPRNRGRHFDAVDREKHDDPDEQEPGLFDRRGQPNGRHDHGLPGRKPDRTRFEQSPPGRVQPRRDSSRSPGRAADRSVLRRSTPTAC